MYGYCYSAYNRLSFLGGFDSNASAFFVATGITDPAIQSAINTLCVDLKKYGVFDKMKAIYPFVGGTASSHSFNLVNTSLHQITWFGGLTHDSNGVTPNGTNGYGNLNFNPRTHLGVQSSYGTYCRVNNASNSKVDFGSTNLDGFEHNIYLQQFGNAQYAQFRTFGNNIIIANTTTNAFFHGGLDTSNNLFLFKNSNLLQSKTPAVIGTPPNINTTLFAYNVNNIVSNFSPRPSSFFFAASGTTQEDNGNIYYCIQKFQTTLGRQVGTPIYSSNATDVNARLFLGATNIQDATITSAVDTLVQGLKTDGIWSKLKAVYPFVGGTATTHKFNLANALDEDTSFRLAFSGGVTHSANGVVGNGVNGYANTFISPLNNLSQNNVSVNIYSRNSITGASDFGSPNLSGYLNLSNKQHFKINQSTSFSVTTSTQSSLGLFSFNRVNATQESIYKNGNLLETFSKNSVTPSTNSFTLLALVWASEYGNKQQAFTSIGDGLTPTEITNLYTRVQAFQTTLNRQV
jgi:hypothetical protein